MTTLFSTAGFTLLREQIADKALEKCSALPAGGAPSAADRATAVQMLDILLAELPLYGYSWPTTKRAVAEFIVLATTTTTVLTNEITDLAKLHQMNQLINGKEIPIPMFDYKEWENLADKTTSKDPARGMRAFVDARQDVSWNPVPNANFNVRAYYSAVVDQTIAGQPPDVSNPWILGLIYGIAGHIGDEFGVDERKLARWITFWNVKRDRGLRYNAPESPIRVHAEEGPQNELDAGANPFLEDWRG